VPLNLQTFGGVLRYEFRMQIRRWSLWLTFLGFAVATFLLTQTSATWRHISAKPSILVAFADVASLTMQFCPLAVGLLLADRLPRDSRVRVSETLEALPGSLGARLWGKYLGNALATCVPMLIIYGFGIAYLFALRGRDALTAPLALLVFLAVALPGILFVAAFSVACPSLLWTPLYQFLFIGYWLWGNLLALPTIPTFNGTLLTPVGDMMVSGFFGEDSGSVHHATALQGVESMALLLALGAVVVFAADRYLRWRQARR